MKKRLIMIAGIILATFFLASCGCKKSCTAKESLEGTWKVDLKGEDINVRKGYMKINFNLKEMNVGGVGMCNSFGGPILELDQTKHTIKIGELMSTRMACENQIYEYQFIGAVMNATSYEINGDKLTLYGVDDTGSKTSFILIRDKEKK